MQKRVLFFNNDVTYFFIHRKKFVNYFLNHNYKVIYSFPTKEKQKLEEYMQKNNEILEGQISFYNLKKRSLNILNELITIFSIFKLILISKPLIIYTTTVKLGLYIILVNNFFRKKIIINFSGLGYLYVKKNIYVIILRKFIEFIFKFSYHNKSIFIFENNEDLKYFTENKKIFPLQRCLCLNGVGVDIQKFQYIKKNIKTSYNVLMVARIEYEKGVFDYLKAKGFSKYRTGELSFFEQIYLFNNAKCIIGAHGAAFTNLVFCKPNTKVIEIRPPTQINNNYKRINFI